jgi:hypothetical protein
MGKRVFINYCHQQGDWVRQYLVPCLKAGGATVLIDYQQFQAGRTLLGQMDATQDSADLSVLVLSPDYLASKNCVHEMERAIARDPLFQNGCVVTVKRVDCNVPADLQQALYIDLRDDKKANQWELLLQACDADLGAAAPDWLKARDEIVRYLQRGQSVNLVVTHKPEWHKLIKHVRKDFWQDQDLYEVDLSSGAAVSRRGLVEVMLRALGSTIAIPPKPEDLVTLTRVLERRKTPGMLAITHFDMVATPDRQKEYGIDFFATLRDLITAKRKLILLIQSRSPFGELLPKDHPLSSITNLVNIELHGRP